MPGEVRVRCNLFEQIRGIAGAFRLLPTQIYTLEQLGLPDAIRRFAELRKGLVVVTGPPGLREEHDPGRPPALHQQHRSTSTSSPSRTRSSTCTRT